MDEVKRINLFEILNKRVMPVLRKMKKFWYVPLVLGAAVAVWGWFSEVKKKPEFSAKITFMLEDDILSESQQMGAGGQLLMALSGQRTQSNKAVLVDLALSNRLVEQTLVKTVVIDSNTMVLANYFMDHCGYREHWTKDKNESLIKMNLPQNYSIGKNQEYDFWLRQFSNRIKLSLKSQVMESGLIVMNFSSNDEHFTKSFLDHHLKTISEFYVEKKIERSLNLIRFAKRKKDSLQAVLTGKTYGLASMQDQGFGAVMKRAKVPELQITRDIGILNQQYNESVVALSGASIELERQKPFITVVDDIRLPLDSKWPSPISKATTFFAICVFLGYALIAGIILGLDFLKTQKKEYDTHPKTQP